MKNMKNIVVIILVALILSCEKEYNDGAYMQIVEVHDTIYQCPPDGVFKANLWRYYPRPDGYRSCLFVYRTPEVRNDLYPDQGAENIYNCPLIFREDCAFDADTLQLFNIGPVPTLSPEKTKFLGNVIFKLLEVTDVYEHRVSGFSEPVYGIVAGIDSSIYVMQSKCNFPLVLKERSGMGVVGDYFEMIEN